MKKTLILTACLASLFVSSCKKDLTCECTTTSTNTITDDKGNSTTTVNDPSNSTTLYKDVKKSNLATLCGDSESTSTSTNTNSNGSTTSLYKSNTKCTIK